MRDMLENIEGYWLFFGALVVIPAIVIFSAYGMYRIIDFGFLGIVLTLVFLINTALSMFFIAHAAPLMSLSSPSAAIALNAYGILLPLVIAFLSGYGVYFAFIR